MYTQVWYPSVPGAAFPMHFSCEEVMTPLNLTRVYFGSKYDEASGQNYSYVAEIQQAGEAGNMNGAVLGRINADSTDVRIWQIGSDLDNSALSSWFEISATRANSSATQTDTLQLSFAANADPTCCNSVVATCCNTGIGCGMRLRAHDTYTFGVGTFTDRNCSANPVTSTCLSSAELSSVTPAQEAAAQACNASAPWGVAELFSSQAEGWAPTAATLVETYGGLPAYGLTNFNTEAAYVAGPPPVPRPPPSPGPPAPPALSEADCQALCSCSENTQSACVSCCGQQKQTCLDEPNINWRGALDCTQACSACYLTCEGIDYTWLG
jgi:hypothetical protein